MDTNQSYNQGHADKVSGLAEPVFALDANYMKGWNDANVGRKLIGTLDLTPSWVGMLPILLLLLDGKPDAQAQAKSELQRMAKLADAYVASQQGKRP